MEQIIDSSKPILVTGASGYIANWIVKLLLEKGCTVHGTVRNPENQKAVAPLRKIEQDVRAAAGARAGIKPGTLTLFKADLLDEGSFDAAMAGCEVVMHTASPFVVRGFKDANEALIRPAVEGTRNVLEAANRTQSVKRVVLTSSVAAVYGDSADLSVQGKEAFDETDWNQSSRVDHQPYSYSKFLAEKEAWKIHDAQSRWHLVTINPSMVAGPALNTQTSSTSIETLRNLGMGKMWPGAPNMPLGWVDVRDVAQAHLEAAFRPDAEGRHIVSNGEPTLLDIADMLKKKYPKGYRFPVMMLPKFIVKWLGRLVDASATPQFVENNVGHNLKFDNSRSRERLGLQYRPLEQTFTEHFQQLIDDGIVR